ncbi:MAG TPA: SdrD B-like domain-containing protein, partial [Longimicrobium sp.]|nr:SdrD B-like domain-containing protein [Longimicrobium sp.]
MDPLPAGVRFVAGSLRLNGAPLTEAADGDAGVVERGADGRETVRVRAGDLLPSAAGTVVFRAVVAADAGGTLENVATLSYLLPGATEPVRLPSPAVRTGVGTPRLTLAKEIAGADSLRVGEEAVWRIRWSNTSAVLSVREAVLVDTLPAGVAFVSADGQPEVEGRVLRWRLGTLAPGASGELAVTTRVDEVPEDGRLVNRAVMRGSNAEAVDAAAGEVHVRGFEGDELEVLKTAGVLEAGLGDAVPYAVTLRNVGVAPVRGIVLRDSLPAGVRYLPGSLAGADSARLSGRLLTIWYAGPLAAGAEHVVRYAVSVVSPGGGESLVNRVTAEAEGGRVRSQPATARVRLRRGFAMQQRVVVGRVWVDADGDGRQGAGERGAGGVEVWSEDGEVVTTDAEGRFSFPNLRAGSHALRLDTLGVPAGFGPARAGDEIVRVRLDGWTLPRVEFRLVPRTTGTAGDRGQGTGDSGMIVAPSSGPSPADANPSADANRSAGSPSIAPAAPVGAIGNGAAMPGGPNATGANPIVPNPASPNPVSPNRAVAVDSVKPATVAPLRTAEERAAEEAQAFASGPVVRIASPVDGAVVASNRLYVGLRGEAGAEVKLFVGDRQVGEGRLRPDGKMDFVGVELGEGPRRVRAWMRNSWGAERWDSVAVHRSGHPARLELPAGAVTMHAGERGRTAMRVRVLDGWGVPVAGGATVTVEAAGAAVEGPDADGSSLGAQAAVGKDGWATVLLRPGHDVGPGELRVTSGDARGRVPLRVLPSTRPLIVTGAGQIGVGAAPDAHGAVTVRGTVGGETTVSVSYDSRRGDDGDEFFDRGFDPLEEGRYPTFGDASTRRVLSGATGELSARVERGYDWMELGDVRTADFGVDERLGFYQRALTGVSGRVSTGLVTWRGFGSVTDQVFTQRQLRADGSSGPYRFGGGIRPGTDRVAVEVRARDNAARVIARQELVRYNDYQIDYVSGDVLLNRPVPMTDGAGNPVFVVATLERRSGGEARFVGGLRVELDAARALSLGKSGIDSLNLSILGVRDEAGQEAVG